MLEKLVINNVALIQRAEIEFGEGLNVLSGETGSGKSVILDSINFVLGAKADRSMIRHGETSVGFCPVPHRQRQRRLRGNGRESGSNLTRRSSFPRKYRVDGRGDIRLNAAL